MTTISEQLAFFLVLAKAQAKVARRFDGGLIGGLGFNDFIILHHVHQAPEEKMRRVDLADKLGLTASGVTRLLLPMEKLGQVKREASEHDGRVSYVKLTAGGKRLYIETIERAELLAEELLPSISAADLKAASQTFSRIAGV